MRTVATVYHRVLTILSFAYFFMLIWVDFFQSGHKDSIHRFLRLVFHGSKFVEYADVLLALSYGGGSSVDLYSFILHITVSCIHISSTCLSSPLVSVRIPPAHRGLRYNYLFFGSQIYTFQCLVPVERMKRTFLDLEQSIRSRSFSKKKKKTKSRCQNSKLRDECCHTLVPFDH